MQRYPNINLQANIHNAPSNSAEHAIAALRQPLELIQLSLLLAFYVLIYALEFEELYPALNTIGPVCLAVILGLGAVEIVRKNPIAIWAPLFWFRVACGAYYGFGSTVPYIANSITLEHIYNLHYFDEYLNLKVNLIYTLGILMTLYFSQIFLSVFESSRKENVQSEANGQRKGNVLFFATIFLIIGIGFRYGIVIPNDFSSDESVIPGMIRSFAGIYYAGIYLLAFYVFSKNSRFHVLLWLLVCIELIVSIVSFAKTELLMIMMFIFLASLSHRVTIKKTALGIACILIVFSSFQPLVRYGREILQLRYGEIRGAGINERIGIISDYIMLPSESQGEILQGGMSRMSYVNVDAFVIDQYDNGLPGETLENALAVFIPRILWPDKPIITSLGSDLNFLVSGRFGSAMGVGHFAEAYWNYGWLGFPLFMAPLALILSLFSLFSIFMFARENWIFLPVIFMGVKIGFRVDGYFVSDTLGSSWTALVLGIALWLASGAIKNRESA